MRSALAATVFALVVAQGCSACIKTKCNTDADCGGGLTCETDTGLCKDNTSSSGSSSGMATSVAGSSGNSGGSSSRVSSGGSSSRVSSGGSSSRPSSSGGMSSSGVVSSSSRVPTCPLDCAAAQNGADAGNITGFACSSGGTGVAACVPTCAPGYANCGGGCTTDVANDPANCGACGRGLDGGGANACGDGGPVCARSNGTVSVCGAANPYCKADKGCVECTSDTHCEATEVCCGNTCVPMGNACGCSLENVNITGMACTAAVGGECIVVASGLPAVAQADYHQATCGCDFMSMPRPPTEPINICNAVSGFLGVCAPSPDGGQVGVCAAQNAPARNGSSPAQNCGAWGNTCDPLKGGLTCVQDGGGVGHCVCDPAAGNFDDCKTPVVDAQGLRHVVANGCISGPDQCGCTANANLPCGRNDGGADCCGTGCVNLRGDRLNCGACAVSCANSTVNDGCNRVDGDAGYDIFGCGCMAGGDCVGKQTGGVCSNGTCVCAAFDRNGDQFPCPVGTYCCTSGTTGCCDQPCGTPGNTCRSSP